MNNYKQNAKPAVSDDTADFCSVKDRALKLLTRRDHSRYELVNKLMTKTDEETANAVADELCKVGLLDDENFARRYADELIRLKGMSKNMIAKKLSLKGISREITDNVLADIEFDDYESIGRLLSDKFGDRDLDDEKQLRRTINALIRLGYTYPQIIKVIKEREN